MTVKPSPAGYHTASPFLSVDNAAAAIEFYVRAFGALERMRIPGPDGRIAHCELQIGNSVLMLSDPFPQSRGKSPRELGGTSVGIFLYVEDVDAVVRDAVAEGATVTVPVDDMFWGDRFGEVIDPFGHLWQIATRMEEIPPEELAKRAEAAMAGTT
jgi:PhnB protein